MECTLGLFRRPELKGGVAAKTAQEPRPFQYFSRGVRQSVLFVDPPLPHTVKIECRLFSLRPVLATVFIELTLNPKQKMLTHILYFSYREINAKILNLYENC